MKRMGWLIVLLMLVFLCGTAAAEDECPWYGDGDEREPYAILNVEDLYELQEMVAKGNTYAGKYFIMGNDLDLGNSEWTPIGSSENKFKGSFDGADFKITGLNVNRPGREFSGLFGYTEGNFRVCNLTVEGNVSGGGFTGGIVGSCTGTISHCTFSGTVSGRASNTGGIAGSLWGSVEYCTNNADVTGTHSVGGIIGTGRSDDFSILWCDNHGNITGSGKYVGGLIGFVDIMDDTKSRISTANWNYGNVTGYRYVGGVAGYVMLHERGYNRGTVTGVLDVGFIYGYARQVNARGTVTIYPNGASGDRMELPIKNSHPLVPGCPYTREGYIFYGWNTKSDASGTWYSPGENLREDQEYDLYAVFVTREDVSYRTPDGAVQYADAIVVDGSFVSLRNDWYVTRVSSLATGKKVTVEGNANLILADDTVLNVSGITVNGGNSITIWGQSEGENAGSLRTNGKSGEPGIGGDQGRWGGSVTINGGNVTATGGKNCPGIGGGANGGDGVVTINGGTVNATGGENGAGIGGKEGIQGIPVTINGGTVTANGGENAAGIGGGSEGEGGTLTVNGGTVNATGGSSGAGIGGGEKGNGGKVTIRNGTVTAKGGNYGAGIGGGDTGNGGTVTIYGGTVIAGGKNGSAGIGGGDYGNGGNVTINGGDVTATGSRRSTTHEAGAGIGGGRTNENNYEHGINKGYGGTCTINGGTVTAISGSSEPAIGAHAIGSNYYISGIYSHNAGTLTISDGLKVEAPYDSGQPVRYAQRNNSCRTGSAKVSLCTVHQYGNDGCDFCHTTLGSFFIGDGTRARPYRIRTSADWDMLAGLVADGYRTAGKYFALEYDIEVSTMIGTPDNPFSGEFMGTADYTKTLTFNCTADGQYCAPFRYISGAAIRNIRVCGTISTAHKFAAGIAGSVSGNCTLEDCRVSLTINSGVSGDGTHGGLAACMVSGSSLTIRGCLFDGSILGTGTTSCGGLVGYGRGSVSISNSIFDPATFQPTISSNFLRYAGGTEISIDNSYCLTVLNDQGPRAHTVTTAEGVWSEIPSTESWLISGIFAYRGCLRYNGIYYSCAGNSLFMELYSDEPPEGYLFCQFESSCGILTRGDTYWNLIMGDEDTVISAVYVPAFTDADFILPVELTRIEAGAFEGDTQITAVDAHNCTFVGAEAFGSCSGLRQIRLDGECRIDGSAFDGCGTLYIYAPAGGSTEDYCRDNGDLIFIGE